MKTRFSLHILVTFLVLLTVSVAAQAQATRTWVSGVGDDANPCSRTAPCKTFAGAISKTATGGEINVLDPGGFGGVTITKSITISSEGFEAGVLVSGTNAIIVNAPTNAVVILRGLDIEGLGTGLNGIRVLAAGEVHVENCTIHNFVQKGIDFQPSNTASLFVLNSIIRDNANAVNGGGIFIKGLAGTTLSAYIENTQLRNNLAGLRVEDNGRATAKNTTSANNTNAGFVVSSVSQPASLFLDSCVSSGNGTNGIAAAGASGVIRITGCSITNNASSGLSPGTGKIFSFGNNYNDGNTTNGSPTPPVITQQ
jgi:hypothetical protein